MADDLVYGSDEEEKRERGKKKNSSIFLFSDNEHGQNY
jgi:hypothetical protein